MAEEPKTPPTDPAGTGTPPPAAAPATQPPKDPAGATEEKTVTLKESDYKNLVSQRDKNANRAEATEAWVMEQAKKQDVSAWLKTNKAKYADVSVSDLMAAESEDELPALAEKMQARIDKATQKKLLEIQNATAPSLTPEQKAEKLAKLKGNNAPSDAFEQMVDLQLQR
jgi:hypothetical protein